MRKSTKNEETNSRGEAALPSKSSASRSAAKKSPVAAKKSVAKQPGGAKQRRSPSGKTSAPPKRKQPQPPSDADIRLRAYFIAERRVQLALQGDPAKDWLEARRQLLDEAGLSDA